jgi:hypothetical protein
VNTLYHTASLKNSQVRRFIFQEVYIQLSFDKGKSGESRRRKANGSTVTKVTMIARPPKTT